MRMARIFLAAGAISGAWLFAAAPALAASSGIETAGRIVAFTLPVAAAGVSAAKNDWDGVGELTLVGITTVGTAFALKHIVHEERPDHSDYQSFPSDTAALAFAPAQYLWDRYGWEYGVPAYAAAGFAGYSRVESKQHHWWDVVASAGIAFGYSQWITTTYRKPIGLSSELSATPDGAYLAFDYRF
jgi:membrane-associated phospholipid phosphatase